MSEIHQQLKEKIQELETIQKIRAYTSQLQTRLADEERDLFIMEKTLDKEQRDVELLEQEGLTTMFHKFLGDREEKLDKERNEYLTASLRYNELFKSVELIRFELNLLSKKEQNQEKTAKEIEVLLKLREEELIKHDPVITHQLKVIHLQIDNLHKYAVEVGEAIDAGKKALNYLQQTEHYLYKVPYWGQRDVWSGRFSGPGMLKKQAIDQARDMAFYSKSALIHFGNELKDVYNNFIPPMNVDFEKFERFMDNFFDTLITDWSLLQKINKSLEYVSATCRQVEGFLQRLEQDRQNNKSKLESLEEQRKQTILNAQTGIQ